MKSNRQRAPIFAVDGYIVSILLLYSVDRKKEEGKRSRGRKVVEKKN